MEYNYELLRKCHGLRFRATIANKPQEGVIKVTSEGVMLCYGDEDPGYLVTFGRRDTLSFSNETFAILPSDFEIVPRDPETYKDWQVGDRMSMPGSDNDNNYTIIIFRAGELVVFKRPTGDGRWEGYSPYTCEELFERGWRLILTDIEKQIIEERKKAEWEPQDGDVVYAKVRHNDNAAIFIYKRAVENRIYGYAGYNIKIARMVDTYRFAYITPNIIGDLIEYRPATDEEKQQLFDAMAKAGKRWNAEKKVVEDIQRPCEFKKFDPVLVRDSNGEPWRPGVFDGMRANNNSVFKYTIKGGVPYAQCIPFNEKTEHLLGTINDYEEK